MTKYFDLVRPTYIENWPDGLRRLSMTSTDITLSIEDAIHLGYSILEWFVLFADLYQKLTPPNIDHLRQQVRSAVERYPDGAFVRLGSRSPKDSWQGHRTGFRVRDTDSDPLRFFLDCSERTAEDLLLAITNNYTPHIWVRQFLPIPEWAEFRCFVKQRRLIGVSQYQDRKVYHEIEKYSDLIKWGLLPYFTRYVIPELHLDDVIVDVYAKIQELCVPGRAVERAIEFVLLEINPYMEMTAPCLYDWSKPIGPEPHIRYRRQPNLIVNEPLL